METRLLGGRYQLERQVGGGGMAIVYRARDLVLNRQVAVKVLRPQFGSDEDFINRFRREAQAVASLSHPNVVSVYDVGQDDDTHYIVMEYIEGSTLKDMINARGALPVDEAVWIALQVCDALDHAHQNKIIHRDIKPHNILIGKNHRVKVTDFGIARAVTSATITHTGSVLGSVHYFSPEQARGGITAEKSDIYSLGIVLYEMVTGQVPFSGESPISVALKHLQDPLPEPRQINPRIPQSVENVILKALVKDPALRYHSAADMLADLDTCLSPERLNEEKVHFPIDPEETRVIPAITPEMLEHSKLERQAQERAYNGGQQPEKNQPRKTNWYVKALIWVAATGLFIILAMFGFNFVQGLLYTPEVPVPPVAGTPIELAEAALKAKKLVPDITEQFDNTVLKGIVISQDPEPPMRLKENGTVKLVVSRGKKAITMPNLIGQNRATAENMLTQNGFTVTPDMFVEKEDDKAQPGDVIDQIPSANTEVIPGDVPVKVTVSKEKRYTKMPAIIGLTLDQAKVELLKKEIKVGKITLKDTYDEEGKVLKTYPYEANMDVPAGASVDVDVSSGKLPAEAKQRTTPIYVDVLPGQTAKVRILVSDVRGDNQVVVEETITESKPYSVPFILAPEKNATIQVFVNDAQYQSFTIPYESQQ